MRQQVEFAEIQNEFGNLAEELLNVKLVNNDLKKQMKEDNDKIILLVKGIESLQKQVSLICFGFFGIPHVKVLILQYYTYTLLDVSTSGKISCYFHIGYATKIKASVSNP